MSSSNEFEARTLEEALEQASKQYGVPTEELHFEVVNESRGFMGHPAIAVTVRVTASASAPSRAAAVEKRTIVSPAKAARSEPTSSVDAPAAEQVADEGDEATDQSDEATEQSGDGSREESASEGSKERSPEDDAAGQVRLDAVTRVLKSIVADMGFDLELTGRIEDRTVVVELHGEDSALATQDGGKTLEALQFLTSRIVRKKEGITARLELECEGLRVDRDLEIKEMAVKAAADLRDGRRGMVRLPPLNPYERRLIHITLSKESGLTTKSEGSGFLKRVVVRSSQDDRDGGRGRRR